MEFGVLGPLDVRHGGSAIPLRGSKQKGLLAILLLHANQVVSAERLIDELWTGEPPESGMKALRVRVSQLRKALDVEGQENPIVTRAPGYAISLRRDQLDLSRFEDTVDRGSAELADGDFSAASEDLRQALGLWRGPPLADFGNEDFAQVAIRRLEELRLGALELRIDADLALERYEQLVGELQGLVETHPLNERFRAQLMRALSFTGRQSEALEVYRDAREQFVSELGIEPSPALRELELSILRQESTFKDAGRATAESLDVERPSPERSLLLLPSDEAALASLLLLAEPLARTPPRELILMQLVTDEAQLTQTATRLHDRRAELIQGGVDARAAAFTTADAGGDAVRLATEQAVDLVLTDAPAELRRSGLLPLELSALLEGAPCDAGLLVSHTQHIELDSEHSVAVPFGGAEQDWAAVELASWIAKAHDVPLQLVGVGKDASGRGRDASRLLARASLIVQKTTGIPATPVLVEQGADALLEAVDGAGLVVAGLSSREGRHELGAVRLALVRDASAPVVLVREGLRPGGLAPKETLTRYTWSMTRVGDSESSA